MCEPVHDYKTDEEDMTPVNLPRKSDVQRQFEHTMEVHGFVEKSKGTDVPVSDEQKPKVEQPEQATATKHPHADFLAEALKDTTRNLEKKLLWDAPRNWVPVNLYDVMQHDHTWEFRFADTVKPEVTSPLTDTELANLWCLESGSCEVALRNIANAAHKAAIKEVAAMPSETTLPSNRLSTLLHSHMLVSDGLEAVANAVISEFQKRILKQLGE
jgi:hypothetical protein